jgi:hydroxymethylpyrimidine/phosphomethylpyrimidine kinase
MDPDAHTPPRLLSIAGSDSGGGAGIQADIKTFAAHGVFGLCAITAITAQNTLGVQRAAPVETDLIAAQIDSVAADFPIHATKIGMLASAAIIDVVADALDRHALRTVVLDPVMVAKGGMLLLDPDAVGALRDRLLPLSVVVTPNAPEAAALTGQPVATVEDLRRAAVRLVEMGAGAALVKGGHLTGPAVDILWDGRSYTELTTARIDSRHTHGTGCTLSSAIAARLALGDALVDAVRAAKAYVTRAIAQAPELGHGHGPVQHFPSIG